MIKLRFLNKITNEELNFTVLTELQANEYLKKLNSDWVQLPIDDKKYFFQDGEIIEKPIDIELYKNQALQTLEILFQEKLNTPVNLNGIEVKPCYRDLYLDMFTTLDKGFMTAYSVKTADGQLISVHLAEMTALISAIAPIVDAIYNAKHLAEFSINNTTTVEEIDNIIRGF